MLNPFVSEYVEVINSGNGKFMVIARTDIPINTVVEICPVSIITLKDAILIGKAIPSIKNKIFADETVMDKEYQIFAQLGELELEKRLDAGEISHQEYVRILRSKVNPSALLELKSHIFMLGNGLLYQVSETPNLVCAYHSDQKVCVFKSVRYIANGTELTYYK